MASHTESVPYFVLRLEKLRAKALFTVPEDLAQSLAAHPILCRGSSFHFTVVAATPAAAAAEAAAATPSAISRTSFLSTVFESPNPDDLADEISKRLANRIDNMDSFGIEQRGEAYAVDILGRI